MYRVTMQAGELKPEQEELLLPRGWKHSLPTGAEGNGEKKSRGWLERANTQAETSPTYSLAIACDTSIKNSSVTKLRE